MNFKYVIIFGLYLLLSFSGCTETPMPTGRDTLTKGTYNSEQISFMRQDSYGRWWAVNDRGLSWIDTSSAGSPYLHYRFNTSYPVTFFTADSGSLGFFTGSNVYSIDADGYYTFLSAIDVNAALCAPGDGGLWALTNDSSASDVIARISCFDGNSFIPCFADTTAIFDDTSWASIQRMFSVSYYKNDTLVASLVEANNLVPEITVYRNRIRIARITADEFENQLDEYSDPSMKLRGFDVRRMWWVKGSLLALVRCEYSDVGENPSWFYWTKMLEFSAVYEDSAFNFSDYYENPSETGTYPYYDYEMNRWIESQTTLRTESISDSLYCIFGDSSFVAVTPHYTEKYPCRNTWPNLFNIPGVDSSGRVVLYNSPTGEFCYPPITF